MTSSHTKYASGEVGLRNNIHPCKPVLVVPVVRHGGGDGPDDNQEDEEEAGQDTNHTHLLLIIQTLNTKLI